MLINGSLSVNLRSDQKLKIFKLSLTFFNICKFRIEASRFFIPEMSFVCPTMLHIKKLGGMHNKETYTRVCARIDICIYAKYVRIICVCVVRIVLSCTVHLQSNNFIFHSKYFPVSDWLKPHTLFIITSCC